jgi:hypothetical protein
MAVFSEFTELTRREVTATYDRTRALSNCPGIPMCPHFLFGQILSAKNGELYRICLQFESAEVHTLSVYVFTIEYVPRQTLCARERLDGECSLIL